MLLVTEAIQTMLPSSAEPVIELHNVSKSIRGATLVHHLSFSVRRGEVCGFLGPNGSGKTTTLRMMVGLMSPTNGEIVISGHPIRTQRAQALEHVGAIIEQPALYDYMSGLNNLRHFARMSRTPISAQRMLDMAALMSLNHAIHNKVKTYSLGMKQRLGIAQALLHAPSILLLDEPTNGLDPEGIRQLRDHLRHLARTEQMAVLVSSHLLSEVELMCDRVVIIQDGTLVEERQLGDRTVPGNTRLPIVFEVDLPEQAARLLLPFGTGRLGEQTVTIELDKETIPAAVLALATGGIRLYQVRTVTPSLEDLFLSLTKGGRS
ncbi:ABC transporter ATP-binding protein [Paenibacillus sp. y28]|uniref:ABC transporter ATP-binding protein n=1 Tax=Paenibacillus sp. y28 TaxID=3129110 RepID=UPI003019F0AC